MTDKHKKSAAFDRAVGCLPDEMTTSDIGIFFHGVCKLFDTRPEEMAALLVLLEYLENEKSDGDKDVLANLEFESQKLTEMFRGDAC